MLESMKPIEQRYRVGEVTLMREGSEVRWVCSQCRAPCEHFLQASAWMTLQSWVDGRGPRTH